jgi:hypothetical protein
MAMPALSEAALALLKRRLAGERVDVTDETRPWYRELAEAGYMIPLHTFSNGPEGHYRLTDAACDLRDGPLSAPSSRIPSTAAALAPRG